MKLEQIEQVIDAAEALPFNAARHVLLGNLIHPMQKLIRLFKVVRDSEAPENQDMTASQKLEYIQTYAEGLGL